jgi:hypothetical protein
LSAPPLRRQAIAAQHDKKEKSLLCRQVTASQSQLIAPLAVDQAYNGNTKNQRHLHGSIREPLGVEEPRLLKSLRKSQ